MDLDSIPQMLTSQGQSGQTGHPRLIVLHGTAGGGDQMVDGMAWNTAHYFLNAEFVAHFTVDPSIIWQSVLTDHLCYHVGVANWYGGGPSIGIEMTCKADNTDDWGSQVAHNLMALTYDLVQSLCAKYDIPFHFLTSAELQAGTPGIATHGSCTAAGVGTDHTDPGTSFPIDDFMAGNFTSQPIPPVENGDDDMEFIGIWAGGQYHFNGNTEKKWIPDGDTLTDLQALGIPHKGNVSAYVWVHYETKIGNSYITGYDNGMWFVDPDAGQRWLISNPDEQAHLQAAGYALIPKPADTISAFKPIDRTPDMSGVGHN